MSKSRRIGSVQLPGIMLLIAMVMLGFALCLVGYSRIQTMSADEFAGAMLRDILFCETPLVLMFIIIARSGGWLVYSMIVTPVVLWTLLVAVSCLAGAFSGAAAPDISTAFDLNWIAAVLLSLLSLFRPPNEECESRYGKSAT